MRISDWSSDVCSSDLTQFYLSRRFEGADPRNDFEGYTLTDAVVRYQTDFGGVSLAVQNLFDEQYISYASDTQRPPDHFFNFAVRGRPFPPGRDYRLDRNSVV